MGHTLPLNHLIDVKLPIGVLTTNGKKVISRLVAEMIYENYRMFTLPPAIADRLEREIKWVWIDGSKLPKRISAWVFEQFDIRLTHQDIAHIGVESKRFVSDIPNHTIMFRKDFNWDAGDFGDRDSCLWNSETVVLDWMRDTPGFYSMHLFKPDSGMEGIARVFLYECEYGWVLFNAYGAWSRGRAANILQAYTNYLTWKKVQFSNSLGYYCPYINDGCGTLLGDDIRHIEAIDINRSDFVYAAERIGWDETYGFCEECHRYFSGDGLSKSAGSRVVCKSCQDQVKTADRRVA
jgi:hypothetical protein